MSLGPLAAGLGKGYSSPAIASLQELQIGTRGNYTSFTITDQEASWVASLSLLGKYLMLSYIFLGEKSFPSVFFHWMITTSMKFTFCW